MNYTQISTDDLSLICEVCNSSELELISFGKINNKVICAGCIKKYDLKDIDNIIEKMRSEKIDLFQKEFYIEVDSNYEIKNDGNSYDSEELSVLMEYTNNVLELKYEISRKLAIEKILNIEIVDLKNKIIFNDDKKLVDSLNHKTQHLEEIQNKIYKQKNVLTKMISLDVYQAINYYKFHK